ncbi:hypothetical protein ACFLU2_02280 [Chloroflexota bacterium]
MLIVVGQIMGCANPEESLKVAETAAQMGEHRTIQMMVYFLMLENGVSRFRNPVTPENCRNDMSAFPDTSTIASGDKQVDKNGNPFLVGRDGDGWVLWRCDITGDGANIDLVNYIDRKTTQYLYSVKPDGTVYQYSESGVLITGTSSTPTPISTAVPTTMPTDMLLPTPKEDMQEAEFRYIQSAVAYLMHSNALVTFTNPVIGHANRTNDMSLFPDVSLAGDVGKLIDINGNSYTATQDRDGWILWGCDIFADAKTTLLVNYVNIQTTKLWYTVDPDGTVHQYDAAGIEIKY